MAELLAVVGLRSGGDASTKTLVPRAANCFGRSGVRPTTEEILTVRLEADLGNTRLLLVGTDGSLVTTGFVDEDDVEGCNRQCPGTLASKRGVVVCVFAAVRHNEPRTLHWPAVDEPSILHFGTDTALAGVPIVVLRLLSGLLQ